MQPIQAADAANNTRVQSVKPTAIVHSTATTHAPELVFLDKSVYPFAICNDGSPAAYVYRQGAGAAQSRWVINLQAGAKCYDQQTCAVRAARSPELISSEPYREDPSKALELLGGIQSADPSVNPDFYDASQVQMLYCSSDDWSGAKVAYQPFQADDASTWSFRGHAIVAAVLDDLKKKHGLNDASEILFSGQSAGGIGAFVNVNDVSRMVPPTARFLATADAGFISYVRNFDAAGAPPDYTDALLPNEIAQRIQGIALWDGSGDSVCASRAVSMRDQVACYYAPHLLRPGGPIKLPMFVSQSQEDTGQLAFDGLDAADPQNLSTAGKGYVAYFAARMRTQLESTSSQVSFFSPDAFLHMETNDDTLFTTPYAYQGKTVTLRQAIGAWYRDPEIVQRYILP
jgi:hypothetical protein